MDNGRVGILGVGVDKFNMRQAVERTLALLAQRNRIVICTPNPEHVICAQKDEEFRRIVNEADLAIADGVGIVIASRLIGKPLPRVPGYDFVHELFQRDLTFYFLGGKPGVAETAKQKLEEKFSGIKILGTHDGYFTDDAPIIADINAVKPDVLIVGLGSPKQEKWIDRNKDLLEVGAFIGAGGSLDGIAGNFPRAPLFMRKIGLEWLYRVAKQPSRIKRIAGFPRFFCKVFLSRFKKNKNSV